MSYFDDQMEAWEENDCQGNIEDYDTLDLLDGTEKELKPAPKCRLPQTHKGRRTKLNGQPPAPGKKGAERKSESKGNA